MKITGYTEVDIYENSRLYNMGCLIAMKQYPDNYFDLAVPDPNYGIGADKPSKKNKTVKQKNGSVLKVNEVEYEADNWDSEIPTAEYFKELFRISKHQIIFGINYFLTPIYEAGIHLGPGRIIWDKLNGESDQYGCEIAYNSLNDRTDIIYYMWAGMMQGAYCGKDIKKAMVQIGDKKQNEKRIHPCQKPVKVYDYLLSEYSREDFKILDTHVGSGSLRISCFKKGLEFTGFENSPVQYPKSVNRFKEFLVLPIPGEKQQKLELF